MKETLTCLIPAGGEGTRLRPHTKYEQKPMLLMGDPKQRIMDFALQLSSFADHTFVATDFEAEKAEVVEEYVDRFPNVLVLRDLRKIGAASLIDYYETFVQEDPDGDLVILPSDQVHEKLSILDFQQYHRDIGANVTLLVVPQKKYGEYVTINKGFAEKVINEPVLGSLSTTGVYMIKNRYFVGWIQRELKQGWNGEQRSMYRDFICPAVENDKVAVYCFPEGGYWDDAGTLERYYFNNMRISRGKNVISQNAEIHPEAKISYSVVIGDPIIGDKIELTRTIVSGKNVDISITQIHNEE